VKIFLHDSTRNLSPHLKSSIRRAAQHALEHLPPQAIRPLKESSKVKYQISISVLGLKAMQKMNKEFRNKDYPTDVLSFSRLGTTIPLLPLFDIGDLLICLPVAKKQAIEYQETLKEELERLTVHGVLHLFGFDHEISKKEEKKMFRLQNKILKSLSNRLNNRKP